MTRIPLWLITLIIGFTLGFVISKPHQTSANVRTGYETLSVVVTLHDTIRTVKTVLDVKASSHIDTLHDTIKANYDRNSNKIWDTGNFAKKLQPEKVLYYNKKISVRSNWDIEESWELE